MKVCVSSRQQAEYMRKADEIRVASRDHRIIPDLAEKYPEADIILELEPGADADIPHEILREYDILCRKKFIVCLNDISPETLAFYHDNDIRYFWGYSITTPYELESLSKFTKVCYVRVGAPLFFDVDLIAKYGIPVRHAPNVAHFGYLPQADGVNGTWIRPEDLALYEPIIGAIEFLGVELSAERALFRIYTEQKKWPGELKMIITNLGHDGYNRMLDSELTTARMHCRQKCAAKGSCQLCWRALRLADPEKIRNYAEEQGLI